MTRPNITPWPSFAPKAFQPTEAQKQAIAAVPALLEALEDAIKWSEAAPAPYRDWPFFQKARTALIAAGYQF